MNSIRLQKFLAECGVGSRRKMENLIERGKVRVNSQVVKDLGFKVDPETDKVQVNGVYVRPAPKGIILLNKPRGVVSTLEDPEGRPTVGEYLTKHYQSYFPVGRLDWDSTGLIILTNDGELAERLMHPRFQIERTYHVRVEGSIPDSVLLKARRGVRLRDGEARANVEVMRGEGGTTWLEVSVKEGRNRLVRRLFERLGFPVIKLKRIAYGPFRLGNLQVGRLRVLTQKEYDTLRRRVFDEIGSSKERKPAKSEIDSAEAPIKQRPARTNYPKPSRDKRKGKRSSRWGR